MRSLRSRTSPQALAFVAFVVLVCAPMRADAALAAAQKALLQQYVAALQAANYADAYALLTKDERRYFGTPSNYASIFAADRLKIERFSIVGSRTDKAGTVALVNEHIEFFDHAHQARGRATAKVAYGIVRSGSGYAIKDPYHPWRAVAPEGVSGEANGVRVIVRELSFYTGRVQMVATFQNTAGRPVTLLPYGRSSLRDESGKSFAPIASKLAGLTDKTLYTGLRLAPSAQYTGLMTFLTPDRFSPASLTFTVAPALFDGGDAPFQIPVSAFAIDK